MEKSTASISVYIRDRIEVRYIPEEETIPKEDMTAALSCLLADTAATYCPSTTASLFPSVIVLTENGG